MLNELQSSAEQLPTTSEKWVQWLLAETHKLNQCTGSKVDCGFSSIGLWMQWPIATRRVRVDNAEQGVLFRHHLGRARGAAVIWLARYAESQGIPSTPLYEEDRIVREIIATGRPIVSADATFPDQWPDCLGSSRYELPAPMERAIGEATSLVRRLITLLDIELESPLLSIGPGRLIPPERRTKPMTLKKAAHYMGKTDTRDSAEWLRRCIDDGTFVAEVLTRQQRVFDRNDFPQATWQKIMP